ncbi:MAG: methyltransferase domain-containing protein [Anaerolineae bacterium]
MEDRRQRMSATRVFAVTGRGLEQVCADELSDRFGVPAPEVAYRRVNAAVGADALAHLLDVRTADDVFVYLDTWQGIGHEQAHLATLQEAAARLEFGAALAACRQARAITEPPTFSVTANFVGKRNYSSEEIKAAVAAGITERQGWTYREDERESDLNVRVFLEHSVGLVGLRLGARPLHRRAYKVAHVMGSLKAPVAAALVRLARPEPGDLLLDPFCGAGTIPIEAVLLGARGLAGDLSADALQATRTNAREAGVPLDVVQWQALELPLATGSVPRIVSNLPWGRQVSAGDDPAALMQAACAEMRRVLAPGGRVVLLTALPELVRLEGLRLEQTLAISLFGQQPSVLVFSGR